MSQNIGTLISSSIRPNDSLDQISVAWSNEIKGGLHMATNSTDRDAVMSVRREWGMMCYVRDEDKLYQLKYNYFSTTITDNENWVEFTTSGSDNTEWIDSVIERLDTPPGSPSEGDRYLIIPTATGAWTTNEEKVAQWNDTIGDWVYTIPTNGMSVRVDNEFNSIYEYVGNYPSGQWNKELISQVRFINATSSNGINYTATSLPEFASYSQEMLFLTIFATANTGASVSINMNSIGDVIVKKLSGTGITDLSPNDLSVGVLYNMSFDGTYFQINIPVGATTIGIIGPAEDGDYSDGLFTDFTTTTPIGTPIDRFNEILKSLVPPLAPILSDWSGTMSGNNVTGKLSFDSTNSITFSSPSYTGADTAISSTVSVDETWSVSGKRFGITSYNSGNLSGTLNDQVSVHTALPTPAYVADSFGDANLGYLKMYVNGIILTASTVDLSVLSASSSGANSGFTITAATSSKFPGGDPFDLFLNRTGTWLLRGDEPNLTNGYNYVYIEHDNSAAIVASFSRILNRFEFIVDDDTTTSLISGATISSYILTGSKLLSGINYYTGGSIRYDVAIDNLYRNTYYNLSDAITFSDQSGGTTSPLLNVTASFALAPCFGNEGKQFKISNSDQNGSSLTFSIISSGKRRINETIGLQVSAKRTIQGATSGGTVLISNVVLDNVTSNSTDYIEYFNDESYRLKNSFGGFQYDLISNIVSNPWESGQSLVGATSGWNEGLQVIGGRLIYPVSNFSSYGGTATNINFGNSLTNYSSASGDRVYLRYFKQVSPTTGNFIINISGTAGTFVPVSTSLTGNPYIHVEIKAPGASSSETGWLDAYSDFATAQWNDGDGARNAVDGIGRDFGVDWGLTIGTKNTANTGGYMIIRLTVSSSFTGYIEDITWEFI